MPVATKLEGVQQPQSWQFGEQTFSPFTSISIFQIINSMMLHPWRKKLKTKNIGTSALSNFVFYVTANLPCRLRDFHPCFKIPVFGHFGWATITKITKITQFFNSLWHSPKVPWQHRFGFMSIPLTVSEEIAAQNFEKSTIFQFWPLEGRPNHQIRPNFVRAVVLRTCSIVQNYFKNHS